MLGNNGMYLKRGGAALVQNLNAVKYSGASSPVGIVDELGNDAEFVGSGCFQGDRIGYMDLGNPSNLQVQHFKYSCIFVPNSSFNPNSNQAFIAVDSGVNISGWDFYFSVNRLRFQTLGPFGYELYDLLFPNFELNKRNLIELEYYNSNVYMSINGVEVYSSPVSNLVYSNTQSTWMFNRPVNNLTQMNNANIYNVTLDELDISGNHVSTLAHYPLCEPITDPANHTYHDVSGNSNHATLVNGSLDNNGLTVGYDYYQNGHLKNSDVPILADGSAFVDGTPTTDPNAVLQDGAKFLNTGTKLRNADVQALKDADVDNVWFDGGGIAKDVTFTELESAIVSNPNVYGGDVITNESIKNITLK